MSGQDSRLTNIEHWTIKRLREGGTYWAEIVDGPSYWDQGLDGQVIEVVPISALRGAVSLIEQARYCVTAALNCSAHPWHGSDEAAKWLIEAARLGGQPS